MKFRVAPVAAASAAAFLLVSCGGESGKPTPPPGTPPVGQAPPPTLNTSLSQDAVEVVVEEGGSATFGFDATYTGSSDDPVVADITVGAKRYRLAGSPTASGKTFTVNLETVPFPAGGLARSEVVFRLCKTSSCNTVYPGSTQTFTVDLDVQLGDWAGFQRNAAHTGYVPVNYDVADFEKAWEWTDTDPSSWIRPPAATRGRILATVGRDGGMAYDQSAKLYSFDTSGNSDWSYNLGEQFDLSGPTLSNGMVHVTSMVSSSNSNPQWVFDLNTGGFLNQMKFASQWHAFNQPTALGNQVFVAAGRYGEVLYAYDAARGTLQWQMERIGGGWADGKTVAVDADYVYYPANVALDIIDRRNGVIKQSIADPQTSVTDVSTFASAPVLGDDGLVFLFAGNKSFVSSAEIIAVSTVQNRILWRSNAQYSTAFAVAGDTIYAVRNDAHVLAALDAKTGVQKWAVPLPVDEGLYGGKSFHGNVVVTENLVFASDHDTTWAVDLKAGNHPIVWEAPTGGRLIITPDNQLLTTGVRENRKLTAYNLF
ncbi:MAG: PQQ-binding-like beta-propeller repeat protein [Verrucomicrobiales bacterium]|nr:PQQ-binding-like beta-propeller repeat protein [Verrucomicrobiales bacterium]